MKERKVIINDDFGGLSFSEELEKFIDRLEVNEGRRIKNWREHPAIIKFIEENGSERSSGEFASVKIEVIPADHFYRIAEYDGMETIVSGVSEEGVNRRLHLHREMSLDM